MNKHVFWRVRHAEVFLVDDICVAHVRYWLGGLLWPGKWGGYAGYICVRTTTAVVDNNNNNHQVWLANI